MACPQALEIAPKRERDTPAQARASSTPNCSADSCRVVRYRTTRDEKQRFRTIRRDGYVVSGNISELGSMGQ
jgi:hypothetical protein